MPFVQQHADALLVTASGGCPKNYPMMRWWRIYRSWRKRQFAAHSWTWRWSYRLLQLLLGVALLAGFLANDRPLLCRPVGGAIQAPVVAEILVDWGWQKADATYVDWYEQPYAWSIWPPIAYGPLQSDLSLGKLLSPLAPQEGKGWKFRHWLGTDQLGHDIAAKMVWGTRTALIIGLGAALLAGILGLLLGAAAGYFGDERKRISRSQLLGGGLGALLGLFWGLISRQHLLLEERLGFYILGAVVIVGGLSTLGVRLGRWLEHRAWGAQSIRIPVDTLVMRLIETLNAIPALILLLAFVAVVKEPSLGSVVFILGVLSWTPMARFVRGELLRIRSQEYIEAAQSFGFSEARILWRHALPNALGPVYIILAFTIAGAIIAEASLSFLGIGMPADTATWGGALANARQAANSAWWMAVFPGLAIFLTVTLFNTLGDELG
jgi:peptide/nickel transport system permease protein